MAENSSGLKTFDNIKVAFSDSTFVTTQEIGKNFALYLGDSAELLKGIPDNSVHYIIFSPPFNNLFSYSNSDRDLGNCRNYNEFYEQFKFIAKELYRVLMPGRLMSFHCMNLPTSKEKDGYIGIVDFRGQCIDFFSNLNPGGPLNNFIFHSEVCIWKNPVTSMQRTKALGLLHKQLKKDSCMSRQGIPDYLVTMRKPGDNPEHVTHTNESFPVSVWQNYASPVWMDINQSDTLQAKSAREEKDEKHICLAEGTLVLTKRGYVPIESVIVGEDEALTHNGRWKRIIGKAKTAKNAEVVQVFATGVPKLIVTPNHKLYAKKNSARKKNKYAIENVEAEWVEAKDSKDYWVLQNLPPIMDSDISEDEWWVIGRWLADGHVDARGKQFFVSIGEKKLAEFREKAGKYIGTEYNKGSCTQIGLKGLSESARNFLHKCGKRAENKVIPIEGISLNKELSEQLLSGYLSGDGHLEPKSQRYMMTSTSRALLLGLEIVAHRARGIAPAIYSGRCERDKVINGRTVHCKQEWVSSFAKKYGFGKIEHFCSWRSVKELREAQRSDVWSIEVEDDHSFTAEGCVVQNCPLQLTVIQRGLELWTNKNDVVLTPFMGIGSEAYMAVKMGRKAVGIELKESYYRQAVANVKSVAEETQSTLFDMEESE